MEAAVVRIAMWSGPRNISTAMMRAFGNRSGTRVVDEPFYAAYLAASGVDHPMREAVIASQPVDPQAVIAGLLAPLPDGIAVHYQKHMTLHMLPGFGLDWMDQCRNAFLIRAPERVLASYVRKRAEVTLADIGFVQQAELFDRVAQRTGAAPPVVDAEDVLADPARTLRALCAALGVAFSERMLRWPLGRRATDGVWAAHWYGAVEESTGFAAPGSEASVLLDAQLQRIAEAAWPFYARLRDVRVCAAGSPGQPMG